MLIHTGLSSASTLGFPLGSVSSFPFQLWILQLSTWMPCSDLLANYPWNICFLAHTREKRYWPVCSQLLQACPLALCFCPYPRTSESLKSARHFSAFSARPWLLHSLKRKANSQKNEYLWITYLPVPREEGGRKVLRIGVWFRSSPRERGECWNPSQMYLGKCTVVFTMCPLFPSSPKKITLLFRRETECVYSHAIISKRKHIWLNKFIAMICTITLDRISGQLKE